MIDSLTPAPDAGAPVDLTLVAGIIRVDLEDIGEGHSGDYDPDDPDDEELCRFTVSRQGHDGSWEQIEDASYCTLIRVQAPLSVRMECLARIMTAVIRDATTGESVKGACEELSWMDSDRVGEEMAARS